MSSELKKLEKKEAHEIDELLKEKKNKEKLEAHEEKINDPKYIENREKNRPPRRSVLEEVGNSVTHGVGAILAIVALILMLINSSSAVMIVSSVIYFLCMFMMFLNSSLYHAWKADSNVKYLWRRFDYTSIYLMIGGTFTPLLLINFPSINETWKLIGIVWLIVMWAIIILGITMTSIFGPGRVKKINYPLYILLGWSGLTVGPIWIIYGYLPLLYWILAGGIVYTLGIIPFAIKVKSSHFIWHFFVLAGAIVQWVGIYIYLFM